MHTPKLTFLAPFMAMILMGALFSGGCALAPSLNETSTESAQGQSQSPSQSIDPEQLNKVKNTPPVTPADDDRYKLPLAQNRALTVFIDTQTFEYVEDGRVLVSGPISSGTAKHPTPTGDYRVMSKDIDKRSGKYTNEINEPTPMPYSMQFRGPYFVHEGWVPGYPDSHGCVRLRYEDARLLFDRMQLGDPVLVKRSGAARLVSAPSPSLWSRLLSFWRS
jgi:lipoprotein-anchoring transpeptidase ErfK/SrfK